MLVESQFIIGVVLLCGYLSPSMAWQSFNFSDPSSDTCEIFIVYSSLPSVGRRIFAGKSLPPNKILHYTPTIFLPHDVAHETSLDNYVFATNDEDYSMIMIGTGSLMNHSPHNNVDHYWHASDQYKEEDIGADPTAYPEYNQTNYRSYLMTNRIVHAGEELFTYYGAEWLSARGREDAALANDVGKKKKSPSIEEEDEFRVCLSDVYVGRSKIPGAGFGLFAARSFQKDDLITVSPVLLLHAKLIKKTKYETILINYCYYEEGSEVFAYPIGMGSMMNHYRSFHSEDNNINSPTSDGPNVRVDWLYAENIQQLQEKHEQKDQEEIAIDQLQPGEYLRVEKCIMKENEPQICIRSFSNYTESSSTKKKTTPKFSGFAFAEHLLPFSVEDLLTIPFAPLDFIYTATRDIAAGEELTLDYGKQWEEEFMAYLQGHQHKKNPQPFRHYLQASGRLFPPHWFERPSKPVTIRDVPAASIPKATILPPTTGDNIDPREKPILRELHHLSVST